MENIKCYFSLAAEHCLEQKGPEMVKQKADCFSNVTFLRVKWNMWYGFIYKRDLLQANKTGSQIGYDHNQDKSHVHPKQRFIMLSYCLISVAVDVCVLMSKA